MDLTSLCTLPQEAEQYLRRHKQELDLLLIGSDNLGVPYIEGVGL